jgi:NitT/TauT family transport system permease protein
MTKGSFLRGTAGVGGFLLIMEVLGRTGVIDPLVLPRASTVLAETARLTVNRDFLYELGNTLDACALGLLFSVAIAVPAGVLLGTFRRLESGTRPLLEFLRPIPSVALIPMAQFAFPDPEYAKISLVIFASSWPLLINTMYGMREVDPLAKETLRSYGFGPLAVIGRVSLPSAAPFILTGLRIATSVTLIVAVSVELFVGGTGIGTYISDAAAGNQRAEMLGTIVWAGLLGLAVNGVLTGAGRRLFRWHHVRSGQGAR